MTERIDPRTMNRSPDPYSSLRAPMWLATNVAVDTARTSDRVVVFDARDPKVAV